MTEFAAPSNRSPQALPTLSLELLEPNIEAHELEVDLDDEEIERTCARLGPARTGPWWRGLVTFLTQRQGFRSLR